MKRPIRAIRGAFSGQPNASSVEYTEGSLRVSIQERTGTHGTVQVYVNDVMIFNGVDESVLMGRSTSYRKVSN